MKTLARGPARPRCAVTWSAIESYDRATPSWTSAPGAAAGAHGLSQKSKSSSKFSSSTLPRKDTTTSSSCSATYANASRPPPWATPTTSTFTPRNASFSQGWHRHARIGWVDPLLTSSPQYAASECSTIRIAVVLLYSAAATSALPTAAVVAATQRAAATASWFATLAYRTVMMVVPVGDQACGTGSQSVGQHTRAHQ